MPSIAQYNLYFLKNLPSAWIAGVRLRSVDDAQCTMSVKHRWINQNPFNSLYFAVQAMAAETATGVLTMQAIQKTGARVSMLVARNTSEFTKKARGRITFTCQDGHAITETVERAVTTGEGQTLWMEASGIDEQGDMVSTFRFEWTVKVKPPRK